MLMVMLKDELAHLRRNRLIQGVLAFIVVMMPLTLLASHNRVQVVAMVGTTWTVHLGALITGSVVTASLISDLQLGVPILFLVRPVPKAHFVLARGASMAVVLTVTLGLGLGALLLLNTALVGAPLDPAPLFRSFLTTQLPTIFLYMASGILIGVVAGGIPSGLAGFMLLSNNLAIALRLGTSKAAAWTGWGQAGSERLEVGLTLLATGLMLSAACGHFSKRPV